MYKKAVGVYFALLCLTNVAGAGNQTFTVGGWLGIVKNKANSAQLGLAGAWAELGKTFKRVKRALIIDQSR